MDVDEVQMLLDEIENHFANHPNEVVLVESDSDHSIDGDSNLGSSDNEMDEEENSANDQPPDSERELLNESAYIYEVTNVDADAREYVSEYFHRSGVDVTFYSNDSSESRVRLNTLGQFEWRIVFKHDT